MIDATGRRLLISALRCLPRNLLSRAAGRLAELPLPAPLRRPLLGGFGRVVGVDFGEVRDPLESFDSLQSFFTRALRPGVRPIDDDPAAFVAPCDGAWGESGLVRDGMLLQIKGRPYSLAALLDDEQLAARFEAGRFATFYLSPRDYHRFHAPCDLRVLTATHVPGSLWPVNRAGLEGVPGLFAENERIVASMRTGVAAGRGGRLCLVAVGATLVGRVRVVFDDLCSNRSGARRSRREYEDGEVRFDKGAEWGRFEFGSTLVLVAEPGCLELANQPPGAALRLGRAIGRLRPAPAGS
jgi:phosphatidylserine decarboxylase